MSYPSPYQPPPQPQPHQQPAGYAPPQPPGWPPPQPGPPMPGFPPPPVRKSKKGPAVAIVGAVLFSVCGGFALASGDGDRGSGAGTVSKPEATAAKAKGAGGPTGKASADSPFGAPVGSTITASDDGDVITASLRSVKTYAKGCNSLNVNPEQGMYVVVDVVVIQKKGSGSVNPLDFKFVADDGTTANGLSATFSGCAEPSLDASKLRAGQKRSGKIAFDAGMKVGQLEWAPGGLGADTAGSWATK